MQTVTLARHAMATRFEIVLHGDDPVALRAAGEEALDEIDRLENRLSLYRPGSEIAQLNARAAREPVLVTPELFALLQHAQQLHVETGGAFDITIAPLVRCWGFMGANGKMPSTGELAAARERVGMQHVQLDASTRTVRFTRDGVMLDLGAIGKGYAVGQAAEILQAAGVASALIHGGTSTVYAIGQPPDADSWKVAIESPPATGRSSAFTALSPSHPPEGGTPNELPAVGLRDEAMSVSAVWGRSFVADGQLLGHVIDPRTGQPVNRALLAAVALASATETDALSTALLVLGAEGRDFISKLRPGMRTLVLTESAGSLALHPKSPSRETTWTSNGPAKKKLDQNAR
jgi:thiamine biosynthesis lipoprotein